MSVNALTTASYFVSFFDKDLPSVKITDEEYSRLQPVLSRPDVKFIQLRGNTYNVSLIKGIERVLNHPQYAFTIDGVGYMNDEDYCKKNNVL